MTILAKSVYFTQFSNCLSIVQCPSNGLPKFQPNKVGRLEIIVLDSRKNKEINLYSDNAEN